MPSFLAIDADAGGLFVATATHAAHLADAPPLTAATAADLGGRLKALLKDAGIRPAPVLLAVGRDRVVLKEVRHPPASAAEEPALVRFQALKELTDAPDDLTLDYTPLPPAADGERRAAVVAAKRDVVAAARALCDAAGLKLHAVTPRPFVAAPLLRRTPDAHPDSADAAVGLLVLWKGGGELTVVRGGRVAFSRPIPAAVADTERLLVGELKRNLAVYAGLPGAAPVRAVFLADADDPVRGWSGKLDGALPVPVVAFDPLAGTTAAVPDHLRGRFAGPVGLLAAADALPINLAAPRQPKPEANPARTRVLVAALLGVLVLGGGAVVGLMETDKANRRVADAVAERDRVKRQTELLDADAKRLAAADEFAGRNVPWLDELYDLADRIPDVQKVRVTEIEGTLVTPPKPTTKAGAALPKPDKPTPAGRLRVAVTADDPTQVDRLVDALNRDRYYAGTGRTIAGFAAGGSKAQQFTVTTDVVRRPPGDYRRKLTVAPPPPPKPATPAPARGGNDFDGFGGGFGGFGP